MPSAVLWIGSFPGLIEKTPHTISLLTNLSAPIGYITRLAELTQGRLGVVSASLHLEFTTVESFGRKGADSGNRPWTQRAHLSINSVLVPGRIAQVIAARDVLERAGLPLFPQIMKVDGGIATYSAEEQALIRDLVGKIQHRIAPTWPQATKADSVTRVEYFVLLQNGGGYCCRTARRHKQGFGQRVFRNARCGNILRRVRMASVPALFLPTAA